MEQAGHHEPVTVQAPHYLGQDVAKDRTKSDRTRSTEIKMIRMEGRRIREDERCGG